MFLHDKAQLENPTFVYYLSCCNAEHVHVPHRRVVREGLVERGSTEFK